MVSEEKDKEFRTPSKWIMSRLENKTYDVVKFVNGYGNDKPYFIAEYLGYETIKQHECIRYSNGLVVDVYKGDIAIKIGKILHKGNLV